MDLTTPINIRINTIKNQNIDNYQIAEDSKPPSLPPNNSPPKDGFYRFSSNIEYLSNNTINSKNYKNFTYKKRYT